MIQGFSGNLPRSDIEDVYKRQAASDRDTAPPPCGADGFQRDVLRDPAQHGVHALLRLAHEPQRPGRHGLL